MDVIAQQLYIQICIKGSWYKYQRFQKLQRESSLYNDWAVLTLYSRNLTYRIYGLTSLVSHFQAFIVVNKSKLRFDLVCYSLYSLAQIRHAIIWHEFSNELSWVYSSQSPYRGANIAWSFYWLYKWHPASVGW